MLHRALLVAALIGTCYSEEEVVAVMEEAAAVPNIFIPDVYQVVMETDILVDGRLQDIVLNITSAFAPLGTEQLYKAVKDHFYDGSAFFRVVPDFVIQFGIAAEPAMTQKWSVPILDDPVEVSNEEGTITFATAGPDTRTTQLFINYQDNKQLDLQGFAPLGQVVQGMEALKAAYNPTPGKPGGVDQLKYEKSGNVWLKSKVPKINTITRAYIRE